MVHDDTMSLQPRRVALQIYGFLLGLSLTNSATLEYRPSFHLDILDGALHTHA